MGSSGAWKDTFSMDWATSWGGAKDVVSGGPGPTATKAEAKQNEVIAANAKAIADAKAAQEGAAAMAQSQIDARKRAMARSRTVFSSPLGLDTQATLAQKTLLGQ